MKNLLVLIICLVAVINLSIAQPCNLNPAGNSISFNGDDDQLVIAGPDATTLEVTSDQFTMEAWVYPTRNFELPHILNKEGEYQMLIRDGEFEFAIANDWQGQTPGISVPPSTWSHIAVTYDGVNYLTYFNGSLVSTIPSTGMIGDHHPSEDDFTIGGRQLSFASLPDLNFEGQIDEVRIWNVARTESEIGVSYSTELIGDEPGLIGYFPFDEDPLLTSVVNIVDATEALPEGFADFSSSFSSDVPCIEDALQVIGCPSGTGLGNSISFDGVDDKVVVSQPVGMDATTALTMEVWVHPTSNQGRRIVLNNEGLYEMAIISGSLEFAIANNWAWQTTGAVILNNQWTHIAVTYAENQSYEVYINGQLQSSYATSGTISDAHPLLQEFSIGGREAITSSDLNFEGYIDEVRIWNVARTATEIAAAYDTELLGTEANLIGYFTFDEELVANEVPDYSVNANVALPVGFDNGEVEYSTIVPCVSEATQVIPCAQNDGQGNSMAFNGVDQYIDLGNDLSLTPSSGSITIEAWIKPVLGLDLPIVSKYNSSISDASYQMAIDAQGRLIMSVFESFGPTQSIAGWTSSSLGLQPGRWYHVAAVLDNNVNEIRTYLDGVQVPFHTFPNSTPINGIFSGNTTVKIGASTNVNNQTLLYEGLMADVRIWDEARSQAQIMANMNTELRA